MKKAAAFLTRHDQLIDIGIYGDYSDQRGQKKELLSDRAYSIFFHGIS